jgi:hypothetical protein
VGLPRRFNNTGVDMRHPGNKKAVKAAARSRQSEDDDLTAWLIIGLTVSSAGLAVWLSLAQRLL